MESATYYENVISQNNARIDNYNRECNELQQRLATLNRWIEYAQSDIDDASEHLKNGDYAK
jgi:peptidoglycan hydrolase CwlO-like protein